MKLRYPVLEFILINCQIVGGLWAVEGAVRTVDLRSPPTSGHGRMFVVVAVTPTAKEVTKGLVCDAAPSV